MPWIIVKDSENADPWVIKVKGDDEFDHEIVEKHFATILDAIAAICEFEASLDLEMSVGFEIDVTY